MRFDKPPKLKDVVCICGTAETTRGLVDWSLDASFIVFNESAYVRDNAPDKEKRWTYGKPISAVIQLHQPQIWRSDNGGHYPEYYQWLQKEHDFPIYMLAKYHDVPSSVQYPFHEITQDLLDNGFVNEFGEVIEYFTSSFCYAFALAIYHRVKEIRIYGIEAGSGTEYERQRAGIAFWMGVAIGRGIKVVRQSKSTLLNEPLYGYTGEVMIHKQRFEMMKNQLEPEAKKAEVDMFEKQGKVKATLEALANARSQEEATKLFDKLLEEFNNAQESVFKYGMFAGQLGTEVRYMNECDELIKAAGGEQAGNILVEAQGIMV